MAYVVWTSGGTYVLQTAVVKTSFHRFIPVITALPVTISIDRHDT